MFEVEMSRLKVRGHSDPVSDQLVGDGLSGGNGERWAGFSEHGVDHLKETNGKISLV